ncbi:hypothetical protein ACVIGB_004081 [Bradyrhizobium sp. USDA 4341]
MKRIAETLGVARSNLVERGRHASKARSPDPCRGGGAHFRYPRLVNSRPNYGYRWIVALLKRERRSAGHGPPMPSASTHPFCTIYYLPTRSLCFHDFRRRRQSAKCVGIARLEAELMFRRVNMPRLAVIPVGSWPRRMPAAVAAGYCGELTVEAFLKRVGTEYPRPRVKEGRRQLWLRDDLDRAIAPDVARGDLAEDL